MRWYMNTVCLVPVHQFGYLWCFMFAYVFRNLFSYFSKYSLTAARARRQYHNNKCYGITFENHFEVSFALRSCFSLCNVSYNNHRQMYNVHANKCFSSTIFNFHMPRFIFCSSIVSIVILFYFSTVFKLWLPSSRITHHCFGIVCCFLKMRSTIILH